MSKLLRALAVTAGLGVLFAPVHFIFAFPKLPTSALGRAALTFLPFTLAAFADWFFEYRPFSVLAPIDRLAARIQSRPLSIVWSVAVVVIAGVLGWLVLALLG